MHYKNLQGTIKSSKKSFIAINGQGFFAVCYTKHLNNDGSCNKIEFTRIGDFTPSYKGFKNKKGYYLLGIKNKPKPYQYLLPKNKFIDEEGLCDLNDQQKWTNISLPKLDQLTPLKPSDLTIISYTKPSHKGIYPTQNIKFMHNLDPKGCKRVGCMFSKNPQYKFNIFDYVDSFTDYHSLEGDKIKFEYHGKYINGTNFNYPPLNTIYHAKIGDKLKISYNGQFTDGKLFNYLPLRNQPITNYGDKLTISYDGKFFNGTRFEGGQSDNSDLVIGSNSFIPGFEDQLIGTKIGDLKRLNLTFPVDYHAKMLAGKNVYFDVQIKNIVPSEYDSNNIILGKNLLINDFDQNLIGMAAGEKSLLQIKFPQDYHIQQLANRTTNFNVKIDSIKTENNITYDGKYKNPYTLTIGSNVFTSLFEKKLIGKKSGDTFSIEVNFMKNFHDQRLAGEQTIFDIRIISVITKNNVIYRTKVDDDVGSIFSKQFDPHFTQKFNIIDTKGIKRLISANFIKIDNYKWGIEIFPDKLHLNELLIKNPLDIFLAFGSVKFDYQGKISRVSDNLHKISAAWKNGGYNDITLDFGHQSKNQRGLTHFNLPFSGKLAKQKIENSVINAYVYYNIIESDSRFMQIDGQQEANFVDYKIQSNGNIEFKYDNNNQQIAYRIPTCFKFTDKKNLYIKSGKLQYSNDFTICDKNKNYILTNAIEQSNFEGSITNGKFYKRTIPISEDIYDVVSSAKIVAKGEIFIPIRCPSYNEQIFLVREFQPVHYKTMMDKKGCYIQGYNIVTNIKYNHITGDDLLNFNYHNYAAAFKETSKIDLGQHILSKFEKSYKKLNQTHYYPNLNHDNMRSGDIKPHHKISFPFVDKSGQGHLINIALLKLTIDQNDVSTWGVEIFKNNAGSNNSYIASGIIAFNKDGTRQSISQDIQKLDTNKLSKTQYNIIPLSWNNEESNSIINTRGEITKALINPFTDGFVMSYLQGIKFDNGVFYARYIKDKYVHSYIPIFVVPKIIIEDIGDIVMYQGSPGFSIKSHQTINIEYIHPYIDKFTGEINGSIEEELFL